MELDLLRMHTIPISVCGGSLLRFFFASMFIVGTVPAVGRIQHLIRKEVMELSLEDRRYRTISVSCVLVDCIQKTRSSFRILKSLFDKLNGRVLI